MNHNVVIDMISSFQSLSQELRVSPKERKGISVP